MARLIISPAQGGSTIRFLFLLLFVLSLGGCTGTSALSSRTFVKPTRPLDAIRVLYIERDISFRSSPSFSPNAKLAAVGYNNVASVLRKRVPAVFDMNRIGWDYASIPKEVLGVRKEIDLDNVLWEKAEHQQAPILLVQIIGGTITSSVTYGSTTVTLKMNATLIDQSRMKSLWNGRFENVLGVALLGRVGFDDEFVDTMLKTVLDRMAGDGIISLPNNQAVIPRAGKA